MKRILFVDDEPAVLDGLRLRLHRLSGDWDMVFVESGPAAVAKLESGRFDALVTDMRMPGMDGAQLLYLVRERWPEVIRIVLSGYAEMRQTMRLVPVAHQYLSKPCEPSHLENVIERCLEVHEMLRHPKLRAIVGRLRKLPALPRTYARLQEVMSQEDVTVTDVARVVASDPAIAAKVLQVVNSAFFRLARRLTNIEQAVTYLGFAAVRNLVLSAEVFSQWPANKPVCLDIEKLQAHVLQVARVTNALTTKAPIADDAMLAALLHDIGYWVLAAECPAVIEEAIALARNEGIPLHEAERRTLGATHAEVGAYLLGIWGMPYPIIEAAAHHHQPACVKQRDFDVLGAVAIAHAMCESDEADAFMKDVPREIAVGPDYLETLGAPFDWSEATRRVAECLEAGAQA